MEKKFEILNYDELPKRGKYVSWSNIKKGFIFKTQHKDYGYNEFEFKKCEVSYLFLKYKDSNISKIKSDRFMYGQIGGIIGKITSNFKVEIGTKFKDDKRDLIITDKEYRKKEQEPDKHGRVYLKNEKWYKYTCNKCGWTEGLMTEADVNRGYGCRCCSGKIGVLGINTIWDTDRWMVDLGVSEEDTKKYTRSTHAKIEVKCPDCGKTKRMAISNITRYKSICCNCSDGNSYLSKYIRSLLDQLRIKYNTEVKYTWNKYTNPKNNKITQARIDFIIHKDGREIPLEADGGFHRKDNSMNGMTAEMQQYIDKQRDENCLKYLGEETIRISDEGDIKENILNSKLVVEFDLSKIDWLKCKEFALKNIVKEVCECWNNKEEWETVSSLEKRFKSTAIRNYLKRGKKLGWCNYNSKEEIQKSSSKNGKLSGKALEVFKEGKSLGIFESCIELERQSEELFGVKMTSSGIAQACRGVLKTYKGFMFKYIENNE